MTGHADFEALSAFVDGEAPEHASHVDACGACRATVAELHAVRAMLSPPVDPVAPADRDRAIAAATAPAASGGHRPSSPTRQPLRWLAPASIAALFAVVVGAVSMMSQGGRSVDEVTTAGPALESGPAGDSAASQARSSAGSQASNSPASAGELGEVADTATLLARARPALLTRGADQALAAAPQTPAPSTLGGSVASGASAQAGRAASTPCEQPVRSREPVLQEVVYFATATRQGVPAYVLGFSTGPPPAPVTLLLLAQDGCGVLLRAAGP